MDALFLDTSALIKLYRAEKGSNWLQHFITGKYITLSELSLLESATVIGKFYRNGKYDRIAAASLFQQVCSDASKYEVIPVTLALLQNAIVEVAMPRIIINGQMLKVALVNGLTVENPEDHP